jgi:hypothetical protein
MGGGGIYNGGGSILRLRNSTVGGNRNDNGVATDGGGVYAFFGANVLIENSTISGNVGDVGGGIRMLGNATLRNSTLSGNTAAGWYGSAVFHTDGVINLVNTTVTGNVAPSYAGAALFVGTFTDASATMNIVNSIVADNSFFGCFVAPFGSGVVTLTSGGNNVVTDGSCAPVGSDLLVGTAFLGPLADNGGPTPTHLPMAGSPAIDAANPALCPATDQRGVARPQGAGCDSGSVELAP